MANVPSYGRESESERRDALKLLHNSPFRPQEYRQGPAGSALLA